MTDESSWTRKWLALALALHLAAAVFSTGYQNTDEHFQILEFLAQWLGKAPAADLAVEYHRAMRPWLQPFLYWVPVRALQAAGVESPFAWATAIRLLSALIGWASLVALVRWALLEIREPRWRRLAVPLLALTWYLPALHARHSSENLSGAVFTIALAWIASERLAGGLRARTLLAAGALCGLAFELRYQVGVMVAGLFFWLAFIARARMAGLARFAAGVALAIAFGTALDRLGYGRWVFAPWNYLEFNFLEGRLDAAGISPVWDYFRRVWTESWPVLAFLNLTALLVFWARAPRSALTWSLLPFFVFHCLTGHKETRFLFPMAHAAPLALALLVSPRLWSARPFRWMASFVAALNLIALVALTFLPALFFMRFYSAVYARALAVRPAPFALLHFEENPYSVNGILMHFYRPENLALKTTPLGTGELWIAFPRNELPSDALPGRQCQAVVSSYPRWLPLKSLRNWTLFSCTALRP
ncbi:MAG: hypothetical protein NDJ89_04130 [Oligoflexia bacterium]|nr:hypothetical protein [Oligoflexia bacterium]